MLHRTGVRVVMAMGLALGLAAAPLAGAQAASPAKAAETGKTAKPAPLATYKTEAEAKTACAGDTVVWHATGSKVFHTAKSKYFGKTKHGAFACEKAAMAKGLHAGKS